MARFIQDRNEDDETSAKGLRRLAIYDRSDTDRTKLLKEVMRSAAKSAAAEEEEKLKATNRRQLGEGSKPSTAERAPTEFIPQAHDSDELSQDVFSALASGTLQSSVSDDSTCADLASAGDFFTAEKMAPILKCSSKRVEGLCSRLQTPSLQVARPPRQQVRQSDEIRIVSRPEANGARREAKKALREAFRSGGHGALHWALDDVARTAEVAPTSDRSLAEQAAAAFVDEHCQFERLEELGKRIEDSRDYKQLRKAFPQRVNQHPALLVLTDSLLGDPGEFRQIVAGLNGNLRKAEGTMRLAASPAACRRVAVQLESPVSSRWPGAGRGATPVLQTPAAQDSYLVRASSSGSLQSCLSAGWPMRSTSSQGGRSRRTDLHGTPSQRLAAATWQERTDGGVVSPRPGRSRSAAGKTLAGEDEGSCKSTAGGVGAARPNSSGLGGSRPNSSGDLRLSPQLEPLVRPPATPQARSRNVLSDGRGLFSTPGAAAPVAATLVAAAC